MQDETQDATQQPTTSRHWIAVIGDWISSNIDFALILAAVTETPRWTVAFVAINEPLWIGVPLGLLLAFATSKAWRFYFRTRSTGMLIFNVFSILMAVAVIAPVLFAMTSVPPADVRMADVLPVQGIWAWAIIMAVTTFVPLIQLAAVQYVQPATDAATPAPVPTVAKPQKTQPAPAQRPTVADDAFHTDLTPRQHNILRLIGQGVETNTDLAKYLDVHPATIGRDIKAIQSAGVSVNGFGGK